MNDSNNSFIWIIAAIIVAISFLVGSFSNNVAVSTPDNSSFEHRYVTERFKMEGYSSSESKQAADAVIKFHNAQKNRQQ